MARAVLAPGAVKVLQGLGEEPQCSGSTTTVPRCVALSAAWQHPYVNVFKLCEIDTLKEFELCGDITENMVSA